jgi:oxygen-dependent protoporphyrinogen oxidase
VVLATPAPVTAALLRPHDDEAAGLLDAIDYASVVLVTFAGAADELPERHGTGFLVPRTSRPPRGHDPWSVTACTFLDRKWPHLAREGDALLRASLGRVNDERPLQWGDAETTERAWEELRLVMGLAEGAAPKEAVVVRHPSSFPQYRVHHLLRTAGVEAAASRLGQLSVAGAAYRGVGIPACIASGRAAARALW